MKMAVVLQVMKLSIIMVALVVVHGSAGENNISPSPAILSAVSPSEERAPAHSYHGKSPKIPKSPAPNLKTPTTVPRFPGPPVVPPISAPPPSISKKRDRIPVASPPKETSIRSSPTNRPPKKGSSPILSPAPQEATMSPNNAPSPLNSSPRIPARKWAHIPAPSPLISSRNHHYGSKRASSAPSPSYRQAPLQSPTIPPKKSRQRHHQAPPNQVPTSPIPSSLNKSSPAPSPQTIVSSPRTKRHLLPPAISPSASFPRKPKALLPPPILALPPPPPNQDCTSVTCTEPLVNSPPGSLCGCVWPMQVGLRLSVALYTFFPLVTELAKEIAAGFLMKQSQVRIMGANAAGQKLDETIVLVDLVPLGQNFDYVTAISAYVKLWHKQVYVKPTLFGDYEVLYVRYPGLPPSPPSVSSSITSLGEGLHSTRGDNGRTIHPLGVDVRRKQKGRGGLGGSMIAIIALSSSIAMMGLCIGAAWVFLKKRGESGDHGDDTHLTKPTSKVIVPHAKPSETNNLKSTGTVRLTIFGSVSGSASPSFDSSIRAYTGSAKTFGADEIKRATDNFDVSRILGEGGFGLVYRGILGDGSEVAVKVLKRNDHQGDREFLAEVEMLSRLHHRSLVKLIGICTEDRLRCLVYELIPNGSVDSHLHGVEREIAPLDWSTRMKIALGAARGLAYLHEDSNPRVIHRDFKSSNILLEHDCNPKVADFGLARSALDEGSKQHISTRVMGTFGYVAPEYAMTGHLLVKSDVYSYGVVLLELLTGRKPVDMSQPQGQENLVTWARPLLTSKQGLDIIIDPSLGTDFPLDSVAKVAAIASMCVQPEVSNRPFMGEVVQALKLVCDEFEETKGVSESYSQEDLSLLDMDGRISMTGLGSGQHLESSRARYQMDYDSSREITRPLSVSEVFSTSPRFARQDSGSFRRHSSSGPLRTGRSRQFWDKLRGLSRGSYSEHKFAFRL